MALGIITSKYVFQMYFEMVVEESKWKLFVKVFII